MHSFLCWVLSVFLFFAHLRVILPGCFEWVKNVSNHGSITQWASLKLKRFFTRADQL